MIEQLANLAKELGIDIEIHVNKNGIILFADYHDGEGFDMRTSCIPEEGEDLNAALKRFTQIIRKQVEVVTLPCKVLVNPFDSEPPRDGDNIFIVDDEGTILLIVAKHPVWTHLEKARLALAEEVVRLLNENPS